MKSLGFYQLPSESIMFWRLMWAAMLAYYTLISTGFTSILITFLIMENVPIKPIRVNS